MTAQAESVAMPSRPPGAKQRKLRNFLLEPKFQLKYTGMVVAVTVVVASVLGYIALQYSMGQTQALNMQMMELKRAQGEEVDDRFIADMEAYARAEDVRVRNSVILGILVMTLALGFTGVIVTHRLVGPAYRLRRLLAGVGAGRIKVGFGLRKGDELQHVFEAFRAMVGGLRDAHATDIARLDAALEKARAAGVSDEVLADVLAVRDRLRAAID